MIKSQIRIQIVIIKKLEKVKEKVQIQYYQWMMQIL